MKKAVFTCYHANVAVLCSTFREPVVVSADGTVMPTIKPPEEHLMWTPDKGVLMAACMKAERTLIHNNTHIFANDCINGLENDHFRFVWA